MSTDYAFECWLDAWCVAWAHIGDAHHSGLLGTGPGKLLAYWYQKGVMMGLLNYTYRDARREAAEQAWLDAPFTAEEEAAVIAAVDDPGEPF